MDKQFKNFVYKATESGSKQKITPPDKDSTGLDGFNLPQKRIIEMASENIVVMGGTSGAGKTHMIKELVQENKEYFSFDFQLVARELSEGNVKEVVKKIVEKHKRENAKTGTILLDESLSGIVDKHRHDALSSDKISQLIYLLLDNFSKVVLVGGGWQYTSEEQTAMIAELMPRDIEMLLSPYPMKHFNDKQLFELAKRIKYGAFQWNNRREVEILPDETARLLASIVGSYLKIPRPAVKVLMAIEKSIAKGTIDDLQMQRDSVKSSSMPVDVFNRAWELQIEKVEEILKRKKL